MKFPRLHTYAVYQYLLLIVLLGSVANSGNAIQVVPLECGNLAITEQLSPTYAIVHLTTPASNWFAGTFTNLATDEVTTLGLSLIDPVTARSLGNVAKWRGLAPVMTYADPTEYETYECFQKNAAGFWVSQDPCKTGVAALAGNALVPVQTVIPADVAPQFLSGDGTFWSAWREVDDTETLPKLNIFRIKHHFAYPAATIAMRIPYTPTFLQAALTRVQTEHLPGVAIDELGQTPEGRALQIIRITDPEPTPGAETATIVVYGGEHATEQASSWVTWGILTRLIAANPETRQLRRNITWLLLPILDPDGRADAQFDRLTNQFSEAENGKYSPEAFAYTRYLVDYAYQDNRPIDVILSLHNVEANESPNIDCPSVYTRDQEAILTLNGTLFTRLQQDGYVTGAAERPWSIERTQRCRLYGWSIDVLASYGLAFEVNDRYPPHRLSLLDTQRLGGDMAEALATWLATPAGIQHHAMARAIMAAQAQKRAAYYAARATDPTKRRPYDALIKGY